MNRDFRKPLILMTPKSLLRHKLAVSTLDEMSGESAFHRCCGTMRIPQGRGRSSWSRTTRSAAS
jgi:2-oxoglutarate dehydrogenase complex dehydrogenase (E1) component-like enzyme